MLCDIDFVDECYAGKDLSLLKKLTIVIPTYNRNYYLSRCLWYHAHFPFGQIIVADSSTEEKKIVNRKTVKKVCDVFGINVLYLEYEPETDKYGGDIYRKWGDAIQQVETEYSQVVTDKEFLIPSTTNSCIQYLDEHDDYSSIMGIRLNLYPNGFRQWLSNPSTFDENMVLERLKKFDEMRCGVDLLLAMQRTKNHKKYYQYLQMYNIDDLRFGEMFLELQPLLFGKVNFDLQHIGKVRDLTNIQTKRRSSDSSTTRYSTIDEYPKEKEISLKKSYQECILEIAHINQINSNESDLIASTAYNCVRWFFYRDNTAKKMAKSNYPFFKKHTGLYRIWLMLPYNLRYKLEKNILKHTKINCRQLSSPELDLIQSITKNIDDKYINDSVFFNNQCKYP